MGCSNEPETFIGIFNPADAEWNRKMYRITGRHMVCRAPWSDSPWAGDMGSFMDDLIRVIPSWHDSHASLIELDKFDNDALSDALASVDLKQDVKKRKRNVYKQ